MPVRGIALNGLPEMDRLEAVALGPTDVVVVTLPYAASAEDLMQISQLIMFAWPGRKAIVLDRGAKLQVVEGV